MSFNYYTDLPTYVSNSTLGDFWKDLALKAAPSFDLQAIFDFGNLVDAVVTEQSKLIYYLRALKEESGDRLIYFSEADWDRGLEMGKAVLEHPMVKILLPTSRPQHVILRAAFPYTFNGMTVKMPTRCKFDIYNKHFKTAIDVKTTSATTQAAFEASMKTFNYFRQAAIYMDLAKIDKMVYIGVSKKKDRYGKYPVFTFAISRGDANYKIGYDQYSYLGFYYNTLIYNFNI